MIFIVLSSYQCFMFNFSVQDLIKIHILLFRAAIIPTNYSPMTGAIKPINLCRPINSPVSSAHLLFPAVSFSNNFPVTSCCFPLQVRLDNSIPKYDILLLKLLSLPLRTPFPNLINIPPCGYTIPSGRCLSLLQKRERRGRFQAFPGPFQSLCVSKQTVST